MERMGLVQSTSVVVFLGIAMRGDWNVMACDGPLPRVQMVVQPSKIASLMEAMTVAQTEELVVDYILAAKSQLRCD